METEPAMIDISNATADEIRLVISELYGMTKDVPRTNKNDNARRVAGKIIKYIDRKNEEKEIKRNCDALGVSR